MYRAASLVLVLEGVLLLAILTVTVMGTQLPASLGFWRISPDSLPITLVWVVGVWLISKARWDLPWHEKGDAPGGQEEAHDVSKTKKREAVKERQISIRRTAIVIAVSVVVTLIAGVVLEVSSDEIAGEIGMSGELFGASFLAAVTALPQLSTSLEAVKIEDYKLAVSDVVGGNAFLPVLFLLASLLSGTAPLSQAQKSEAT
jgi:cation:H+ antiporter